MAIPTHDITCITKSYQMPCPACKEQVWFFSCSCGSKTFFNELGYPWEQHTCRKHFLEMQIKLIKDLDRLSDLEVYDIIATIEKKSGRTLNADTEEMLADILGKRKFPLSVTTCEPDKDSEFSGKVMQVNTSINIFKKLGYDPEKPFAVKLLGKLTEIKWAQIIVRSNPDKRNKCLEYEIYMTQEYLKKYQLRQGNVIAGILNVVKHPKGLIWQIRVHKVV
jgi:hypothetical protein